jgi:hypothetical protein
MKVSDVYRQRGSAVQRHARWWRLCRAVHRPGVDVPHLRHGVGEPHPSRAVDEPRP